MTSIRQFVEEHLGHNFISTGSFDLKEIYDDSTAKTPLIFILSPGIYQFHSLHSFCTFSCLVACYKNCFGVRHWSFGPAGQICRGAARQCLTPRHDLPGSRSRPQSRGVDLKGPDPEGPLGVSTELSSGSLLHAKAPGHCRKVSSSNQLPLVLSNEYIVFFLKKLRKRGRYSPHELLLLKNSISIFFKVHVILLVLHFFIWIFHSSILKTKPCRRWPRSSVQTLAQL